MCCSLPTLDLSCIVINLIYTSLVQFTLPHDTCTNTCTMHIQIKPILVVFYVVHVYMCHAHVAVYLYFYNYLCIPMHVHVHVLGMFTCDT